MKQGLRVLNTRPKHQAAALSRSIIEAGGLVIECPTLEISATQPDWTQALPDLQKVDLAIFISPNAVHFCFAELQKQQIIWPNTIKVCALGQGTAKALEQQGLNLLEIPNLADSEHLLELKSLKNLKNQTVLLFKGEGGRTLIEESLLKRGAKLIKLAVYKRELPQFNKQLLESIWRNDGVDIILVTSEQSLNNLFLMFGSEAQSWLQSKLCLVLSERLAQYAASLGIKKIKRCQPDTIINALFET
ncbi:MAG: uroporphyrinogen-III synthase [Legionella sp.]|jgi:uroporphyrinogen-III synthase